MSLYAGQTLENRYRIDALLGQGGMGAVYGATDLRFNARVAIKENQMVTAESQKQFVREAELLYRLRHPSLPRVIDHLIIPQQGQYLVMDYVDGEDLKQVLARCGSVAEPTALAWMRQVLDALEYLHNIQIIHRDVKPANVKITPQGRVFLVDFGLAKVYDPRQLTTLGARGVTPGYAPPEQYGQGRTDARSDVYSAAATLYALLTGHAPPDALEYVTRQTRFPPPRELNPGISPHVEAAILRAMQTAPEDRFQTVDELSRALFEPATFAKGVDAVDARPNRAPTGRPEPAALPPTAATRSVRRPATGDQRRPQQPRPRQAGIKGHGVHPPAKSTPQPQPIRWRRVVTFALIGGLLGAVTSALSVLGVALVVLGLLVHHTRRVLQFHPRQYQVEVLGMWLSSILTWYLGDEILRGGSELGLGTTVVPTLFIGWLPSAILGLVVLWLARRRALGKLH